MKCLIRGKICRTDDAGQLLASLADDLTETLSLPALPVSVVVSALDKLGKKLIDKSDFVMDELLGTGLSKEEAIEAKAGAASVLDRRELYLKLKRELPVNVFAVSRVSVREPYLEGLMPLGVLGHVTSSNDAFLPFLSAVEGLLTGNINVVKTAAGAADVAIKLAETLCEIEPRLASYIHILPVSSKEKTQLKTLFSLCDGIAVWGSENAVRGVSELAPPGVPVIAWGHRISFSYVTKAGNTAETLAGIARDVCVNDQQACSAPQVVYFETESWEELLNAAHALAAALAEISPLYFQHEKSDAEQAEITGQTELMKAKEIMGDGAVIEGDGYRLFVGLDMSLESSPLYRTVLVKPMKRDAIIRTLRPFRSYLQSAGLAAAGHEIAELAQLFYRAGVTRLTSPGGMANGYTGEPHDGVYALSRYVRRVSIENTNLPAALMDLGEMRPMNARPFADGTAVLKKADFQGKAPVSGEGYLLLKSGGSSGKSVYAPHTYGDAETTYITAGRAMVTAGITPDDKVMNLFYSGSLYGGFLSMYEGLKHIDAIQLPMASVTDFAFAAREIAANGVNVVMGMPSYLLNFFTSQKAVLRDYGKIKKIFYGGEHMDPKQVSWYQREFGAEIVRSLVYGCNEIGSIGYVCEHCAGSEHHLFDTMHMEILKMDADEPVSGTEAGRIVLTPVDKSKGNIDIDRYEIGDLGRWVTQNCPCGRSAPKFELLGRFGDTFKFATNYVNYSKIKSILAEAKGYTGNLQIVLEYAEKDSMRILVDKDTDAAGFMEALIERSPEINETMTDNTGVVRIEAAESFAVSSAGGKVRNVVDMRK